jgi:hypothetical protein
MDLSDFHKLVKFCASERAFVRNEIIPKKKSLGRRMLTHLAFAHCEAIAYYLKSSINVDYEKKDYEGPIEIDRWLASLDEEYIIDENGQHSEREKKTKTLAHLLFVLRYAAKYLRKEFDPKAVADWQHVKPAFQVRDRITHPKSPAALSISEDDLSRIDGLERWLEACLKIIA